MESELPLVVADGEQQDQHPGRRNRNRWQERRLSKQCGTTYAGKVNTGGDRRDGERWTDNAARQAQDSWLSRRATRSVA